MGRRIGCLAMALALLGCSDDEPASECAATIAPGANAQSELQTALIETSSGGTVCLAEGNFSFNTELSIAQPLTLRGAGRELTIIDFSGQDLGANGMQITGDNVTVEDFTMRDPPGDGIRATAVRNITYRNVAVIWSEASSLDSGAYGFYPVGCQGVRVEGCLVVGCRDAGIYVGQSSNILVTDSEAHGNVAGIEIENSTDAEVVNNYAHDNTGGILVFNLPGLPVQDGKRTKIHNNIVENNNLPSFAEPGTVVADVPAGTGILVLAADVTEIHDNVIDGNDSVGVVIVSYLDFLFGGYDDPSFNAYPEGNWIHDNEFSNNGTDPDTLVQAITSLRPVPDMAWDGCHDPSSSGGPETVNCVSNNGDATYLNFDFCGEAGGENTDIEEVTCEHETLPSQNP